MKVLVFDVNETLLDLAALDGPFEAVFGSADVRREWFQQFLQSMLVSTITGPYVPFPRIARAALDTTARRHGRTLGDADAKSILARVRELPPHPDARPALERLRAAGFRLATLTNSTAEVAEDQLQHAGIRELFERVLSADEVQRLKPASEPYHMAAKALGVPVSELRLIAAHAWDIAGAIRAGCAGAFVAREGRVPDELFTLPDVSGPDLSSVADRVIAADVT